jgi:acyl carrier protein
MNKEIVKEKILNFLLQENKVILSDLKKVEMSTDLVEFGVLDSILILELLVFLESTFQIDFNNSNISIDDLKSINNIYKLIQLNKK